MNVLLGNGDGTLQAASTLATGIESNSVAVADFDSDGVPDLVVANLGDGNLSVLLGNVEGSFQGATSVFPGSGPIFVAAADLDGDGRPDLVTGNPFGQSASVLLNQARPPSLPAIGAIGLGGLAALIFAAGCVAVRRPRAIALSRS